MAEALILEFKGVKEDHYKAVNDILGVDSATGKGSWPPGIISHTAGMEGDAFVVFEVWESKAHQEAFMNSRLGPALGKAGVPEPTRAEWFSVVGQKAD